MQIIDCVHVVPNVMANSYLVLEPEGLTVIDTGMPFSEKQILKYLSGLGRSAREIQRILITHADLDHYGCLAALQQASGARTFAGRAEAEAIAQGVSSRPVNRSVGRFQRFMINMMSKYLKPVPVQVDELLAEGQVLPVLGGLQVVESPGHSPGHLSFFAPSAGVLFCGDSMRSDGKHGLRASRSRNNWDQEMARASVARQAALGAQVVCPGHGPAVFGVDGKFPLSPHLSS